MNHIPQDLLFPPLHSWNWNQNDSIFIWLFKVWIFLKLHVHVTAWKPTKIRNDIPQGIARHFPPFALFDTAINTNRHGMVPKRCYCSLDNYSIKYLWTKWEDTYVYNLSYIEAANFPKFLNAFTPGFPIIVGSQSFIYQRPLDPNSTIFVSLQRTKFNQAFCKASLGFKFGWCD